MSQKTPFIFGHKTFCFMLEYKNKVQTVASEILIGIIISREKPINLIIIRQLLPTAILMHLLLKKPLNSTPASCHLEMLQCSFYHCIYPAEPRILEERPGAFLRRPAATLVAIA